MSRILASLVALALAVAVPAQESADAAMRQGQAAVQEGDFQSGITAFRKVTELEPDNGRAWQLLGYCLHLSGDLDAALPVHEKAAEFADVRAVASYNIACVHGIRGDKEQALAWLEKAVAAGFDDGSHLANDPDFDLLREDPRFQKLAKGLKTKVQVYAPVVDRKCSRVALFAARQSPGQIAIAYSTLAWQDGFDKAMESPKFVGKKWRFGREFWTTLDNSMPLQVGGVEIPAGYWYLTLEHKGDHRFVLGVHEPKEAHKLHLDPFRADLLPAGIEVPLAHADAAEKHDELDIRITVPKGHEKGELQIGFGGHELSAPVVIELDAAR
ncbi:MAG: tetratricopeptide repeat protein [Planctomycetota bacterium]